ncbi:MAG TPA: hypothetical protein PLB25_11200 [Rhodoferax sp.]|nr:hypothetical protein [Rhodoferax sp.]
MVWFEYAAGINAQLNQAMDQLLKTQPRLGDADLSNLYQLYVVEVDPNAMQRIGSELQRVMQPLSQKASAAGGQAGEFGMQLETLVAGLLGASDMLVTPSSPR